MGSQPEELSMSDTLTNVAEQRPSQIAVDVAVASILVYVDFDAESDNRIKIAADWARKFNASLIGVAGWLPGREIGGWFADELEPAKERNDRILLELGKLGEHFRNVASRMVQTMEWRGSFHFPRDVIPAEARSADLVVISSHPVAQDVYSAFDPGEVLLNAGRPVLMVPDAVAACGGQRILIAWKDTREARHAVQGALPFLKSAEHVSLVEITEKVQEWAAQQRLDDVERYLTRHRVKVRKKLIMEPKGPTSDQLMSVAKSEAIDLIVAGAYGHSRLGEWVFGGVTHGLLQRIDICGLFAN
jgi:nucleotide-binding universal stress UspA family protein